MKLKKRGLFRVPLFACGAWSILILKKRKSLGSVTRYRPRKVQADNSAGHLECTRKVAKQLFPQGTAQMRQKSFTSAVKRRKEGF